MCFKVKVRKEGYPRENSYNPYEMPKCIGDEICVYQHFSPFLRFFSFEVVFLSVSLSLSLSLSFSLSLSLSLFV